MATLKYVHDDTVMLLEDEVLEIFSRVVEGSGRIPLVWAGARLEPRKGDQIRVHVGTSQSPNAPFYDDGVRQIGPWEFDVPATEEQELRAFFDEAARRAGRS
jgi:hypothetical protein